MSISLTDAGARGVSNSGYPTTWPAGAILDIYDTAQVAGSAPAGMLIGTGVLPATPWTAAPPTGRAATKNTATTWQVTGAAGAGAVPGKNAAGFRLRTAADTNAATQAEARVVGTVTATGGGGDMTMDNINMVTGQVVTITSFSLGVA